MRTGSSTRSASHSTKARANRSCRQPYLLVSAVCIVSLRLDKASDGCMGRIIVPAFPMDCNTEPRAGALVLLVILDRDQTTITEAIACDECGPRLAGCQATCVAKSSQRSQYGSASAVFSKDLQRSAYPSN
ncbi:uncharacterized protein CC84DRAFT_1158886 [Paraphaeosphaeria sporulosa]|uniref:Uncharacterized protein n=1 Tax=Paraphaeosphaeria sporulosa TaxID=1460663 RepID=A0A177CWC5_9PLEO|nr:uncharacterized protein CC84DRAFT_1158886 [Paraphaeosphaeria sporulosa]OAG11338.1 hypothetical protein CC84DRAFT_1158886 [Paraphaeosphaeria sporulosa]